MWQLPSQQIIVPAGSEMACKEKIDVTEIDNASNSELGVLGAEMGTVDVERNFVNR